MNERKPATAVDHYSDPVREYRFLRETVALLDLSGRGRLCVTGPDRQRFLHGQVTNDINKLAVGTGCYTAITNAKGKLVADANVYCLQDELLLDVEPGFAERVTERLEKYIIADDVAVVDVSALYGMLSLQGPRAKEVMQRAMPGIEIPVAPHRMARTGNESEIYCAHNPRGAPDGFDLFIPQAQLPEWTRRLEALCIDLEGGLAGWQALECARIEAGIPRMGQDMDENNLAPEAGLDAVAISYSKGCYIGQEIIARIRTYGQVKRNLRLLRFETKGVPSRGDKLFSGDKEAGYVTSAVQSFRTGAIVGLGYVNREQTVLMVQTPEEKAACSLIGIPFEHR